MKRNKSKQIIWHDLPKKMNNIEYWWIKRVKLFGLDRKSQIKNTYMDLLFDEVTNSINKMLNLLINEQLENGNDLSMSCNSMNHKSLSIDSNYDCNISSHCSTNAKSSSVKYKRLMQENLSLLNKTIERVRKNLICLVTTSSTISGLKQVRNSLYSVLLKLNLNDYK